MLYQKYWLGASFSIPPPLTVAVLPTIVQLTIFTGPVLVGLRLTPPAFMPALAQTRQFAILPPPKWMRTPPMLELAVPSLWSTRQCVMTAFSPSSVTPAVRLAV